MAPKCLPSLGPLPTLANGPVWTRNSSPPTPPPACFWQSIQLSGAPLAFSYGRARHQGAWVLGFMGGSVMRLSWANAAPFPSIWRNLFFNSLLSLSSGIFRVLIFMFKKQTVTTATINWLPTPPSLPPLGWLERKQDFLLPGSSGQSLLQPGSAQPSPGSGRKSLSSSAPPSHPGNRRMSRKWKVSGQSLSSSQWAPGSMWAFRKTIQNFPNGSVNGSPQILYTVVSLTLYVSH